MADVPRTLDRIQDWMQSCLIGTPPAIQFVDEIIAPSCHMSSRQRLAIYQRGYLARLRECMAGQFRTLRFALGEELFQAFADEYLVKYPSESHTLADLGRRFGRFLQETRPDADAAPEERESWPDFMIELAEFEYALAVIFDHRVSEPLTLADESISDASLALAPCVHLFHFRFPINGYYQAVQRGDKPELPFPEESFLAVNRRDYQLGFFNLRQPQFLFLKTIAESQSVARALESLAVQPQWDAGLVDARWQTWRKDWLSYGFFCAQDGPSCGQMAFA